MVMKPGDIVFVTGTGIISRLVRKVDKGRFSHVAIAVSETEVLETNWYMKSKIVPFYYEDYEIVDLGLADWQRRKVLEVAKSLEGRWYDYLQILGYLFLGGFNNPRHLICSELVFLTLYEIGYTTDISLANSKPNELYEKLTKEHG